MSSCEAHVDAADIHDRLAELRLAVEEAEAAQDEDDAVIRLRPWFEDITWLSLVGDAALQAMARDPLHLFGLTALSNGPLQQLLLTSGPRISVSLCSLFNAARDEPPSPIRTAFAGNRSLFRLISTESLDGRLACRSRRDGICRDRAMSIRPGTVLDMDEARWALWIAPPRRPALFLRFRFRRLPAPLVRSYTIGEAVPISLANGDDGLGRSLAMTAVLRALGTAPPVDALRSLLPRAHGRQRWDLMREMLAADTCAALPDLLNMAGAEPDAAVRDAARRLVHRLTPDLHAMSA